MVLGGRADTDLAGPVTTNLPQIRNQKGNGGAKNVRPDREAGQRPDVAWSGSQTRIKPLLLDDN